MFGLLWHPLPRWKHVHVHVNVYAHGHADGGENGRVFVAFSTRVFFFSCVRMEPWEYRLGYGLGYVWAGWWWWLGWGCCIPSADGRDVGERAAAAAASGFCSKKDRTHSHSYVEMIRKLRFFPFCIRRLTRAIDREGGGADAIHGWEWDPL